MKVEEKVIDGERWIKFSSEFDKIRYYYGNMITVIAIIILVILGGVLFWYVFKNVSLLKTNPCRLCEELGYIVSQRVMI